MKGLKNRIKLLMIVSAGVLLASCRKDLCYDHNHAANVDLRVKYTLDWYTHWAPGISINPDWSIEWNAVIPQEPEGVRLLTYPHYEELSGQTYNMPKSGGKIVMASGRYDLLFYNNDTEYILFGGKGNTTVATTRTRTRASYSKAHPDEITVNPPDMLFAAYLEKFYLEEMPENDLINKIQKTVDVNLSPRVFSYVIRYEFKAGLEYVAQCRGALSGMAGSVFLSTGHTEEGAVTVLYDCRKVDYGCEAVIRSFGVPGVTLEDTKAPDEAEDATSPDLILPDLTRNGDHLFFDRNEGNKVINITRAHPHRLTLELYLINGKEKVVEIDVTDQVNQQPRGGVIVVKGLEVTEKEGQESTGGGFDTDVGDWEDDKIVDIPID